MKLEAPQVKTIPTNQLFGKFIGIKLTILALSYLILQLTHIEMGKIFVSGLIIVIILLSLPSLRGPTLIITSILLVLGIGLMIISKANFQYWIEGLRVNLTLVTIFILTPLLGIPVRTGNYIKSLQIVFSSIKDDARFLFLGSKALTHVLGVVLNIGAVSISHHLSKFSKINSPRLMANSINRGFTSTIYWSPYFSAMVLIISQLEVTWSSIVFYSLGLVLISFLVSIMLEWNLIKAEVRKLNECQVQRKGEKVQEENVLQNVDEFKKARKKVIELFLLLAFMMIIVLAIEALSSFNMILIICFVAIFFPIIWCFLMKEFNPYKIEFKKHLFETLPRMRSEITLFLVAGFFSAGFIAANLSTYLLNGLEQLFGTFTFGIALSLALIVVIGATIGLHPIVLITIFVTSINPQLIGFSPEYFALLLLTSWGISNNISPATAVNNLLANLLNVKVTEVSIKWNYKYVLIMIIILPIYLNLLKI